MTGGFFRSVKTISSRSNWREILAIFMLLLAIVFFRSERKELAVIVPNIQQSNSFWLLAGLGVTLYYIFIQGGMYKTSFSAIGVSLQWKHSIQLYLKRNFISVFLPAGGITSLSYSPSQFRQQGVTKTQLYQASGLFWMAGMLTLFIAGLAVALFNVFQSHPFQTAWMGLLLVLILFVVVGISVRSITAKGRLYQWVEKKFSSLAPVLTELFSARVNKKTFSGTVIFSLQTELCGMLHVYIAMLALGLPASAGVAASAYIIAVLMAIISPFLRGLGAVELSMVYLLEQSGYNSVQALSVTVLYRVFEFWLPLLAGLLAFAWKGRKLFLRLAPALLTLSLGFINIIYAIKPPIHNRINILREYLPLEVIHASHLLVLFTGLFLLLTSAFLFRGLRNAWYLALILSGCSLLGHITKALDYEASIFAAANMIVLLTTASQYQLRSSRKWIQAGMKSAALGCIAILLFGVISFYFTGNKHFGNHFNIQQSLVHAIRCFMLVDDNSLVARTRFGNELIWLIRSLGFITWGFLLFSLIRPQLIQQPVHENYREKAGFLLKQFGNSATDYFKIYKDKLLFFSDQYDAFIAYRIARGFAIVLEEPVCADEHKVKVLSEFDRHCHKMGLKTAFYRVDENSIPWFNQLRKHKLKIGQEAILDINHFTLEGRNKKSLRNGLNSLQSKGYATHIHRKPHSDTLLSEIKKVSDEWLESFSVQEIVFSQGMFDEKELQQLDIITLTDADGYIKAFLDIIPDFAESECTYDLIRKTNDAPGAAMDALIIRLIDYAREKKHQFINLGMVPMTSNAQPDNTAEQIIRLAAARIKRFQHYKGLRDFKEKYATWWETKYLVYDHDVDLLQLPLALNNVMKP